MLMNFKNTTLLIIFIALAPFGAMGNEYIKLFDRELYEEIKGHSKQVLKLCPPEDCQLLALGRNPTPFVDFINLVEPGHVRNIALSNFRYNPHEDGIDPFTGNHLSKNYEMFLYEYFHIIDLKTYLNTHKRTMILDFGASTGGSLYSFENYLKNWLERIGLENSRIESLPIVTNLTKDTILKNSERYKVKINHSIVLDEEDDILWALLYESKFDHVSQWSKFDITKGDKFPTKNFSSNRLEYLSEIFSYLDYDDDYPHLEGFKGNRTTYSCLSLLKRSTKDYL